MYNMIFDIVSPPSAPQIAAPAPPPAPAPPKLDPLDRELMEAIRQAGQFGVHIWSVLDQVAAAQNPECRSDSRLLRLQLWERLRRLLRGGLLFRCRRNFVSATKLPKPPAARRRRARAGRTQT